MDRVAARLRLRDFQIGLTIASKKSLRLAAIELGITQPAMTYALREIEDIIGGQLFLRSARGVEPTEMGREFLLFADHMVRAATIGLRDMQAFAQGIRGELRLGFTPTATVVSLPSILMAFRARAPDVLIRLYARASRVQQQFLLAGEIDVAAGPLDARDETDEVESIRLTEENISVVCGVDHPLLRRGPVDLAALTRYPWIYPMESNPTADQIQDVFRKSGLIPPPAALHSSSVTTNREIIATTDFICTLPEEMARAEAQRSGLAILMEALPDLSVDIGMLTLRRATRHPIIELFMDTVRNHPVRARQR